MSDIVSMGDFAARLAEDAELVVSADPTTFTDPGVMAAATALAKALEGAMIDGRTVTGELPAVVVEPQPGEQAIRVVRS